MKRPAKAKDVWLIVDMEDGFPVGGSEPSNTRRMAEYQHEVHYYGMRGYRIVRYTPAPAKKGGK